MVQHGSTVNDASAFVDSTEVLPVVIHQLGVSPFWSGGAPEARKHRIRDKITAEIREMKYRWSFPIGRMCAGK